MKSEKQRRHLEKLVKLHKERGNQHLKKTIEKRKNNGKPWHSKETIEKIRLKAIGRKQTPEQVEYRISKIRGRKQTDLEKQHHSEALKGKKKSKEHCKNLSIACKGRKVSEETRRKIGLGLKREKHPNWQGGKSFETYGLEFNNSLKESIRKRDNYTCQECEIHQDNLFTKKGKRYKLSLHHIDYNKKNNKTKNLISLCKSCHTKTNFKRKDWTKYFYSKL